jgi:hypothetical protein
MSPVFVSISLPLHHFFTDTNIATEYRKVVFNVKIIKNVHFRRGYKGEDPEKYVW